MNSLTLFGLLLAFVGGGIQGAFVFPMKFMRNSRWENGWFWFSLICCLVIPLTMAFATIPGIVGVYQAAGLKSVALVFLFGLGWGVGVVLFGLGAEYLGMALGVSIITGINVCLGALLPILFLSREQFTLPAGLVLGAALLVMVGGVGVISRAGQLRETERGAATKPGTTAAPFKVGLLICIVAGLFCPSTNFAVFFGQPITEEVKKLGTVAPYNLGYAMLLPWFLGGWLINTAYCVHLLKKNASFSNFTVPGGAGNFVKALVMSLLFMAGMVLYTLATSLYLTGGAGAVVGWPVFMGATISASTLLGVLSGEWRGVSRRTYGWLFAGVALLVGAVALASSANLLHAKPAPTP